MPDWNNTSKKVIAENGICVDQCIMTENYKYEYETKCYSSCPKGTTSLYNKNFLCQIFDEIKFNNENNNKKENTNVEMTNAIIKDNSNIFFKICQPRGFLKNECSSIKTRYDSMISMIKTDIKEGAINELLEDLLNGNKNDIYKEDEDVKYQITTSDNQKNNKYGNISTIDLKQCEDKLKCEYNISQNYSLLIFKYDYYIKEIYPPIIGYEVYHPITKEILDLNYCKMNKIDIIIPIDIKENELYKHEPNNLYYKDKCYSFHNEKGIDLTIYDRKKEYNDNNLALCTDNCYFDGYDNETKKVKCICEPQSNSSLITLDKIINKKKLLHNFIEIRSNSNIDVIKCYKNFFSLKGFIKNIGSYILLITLLIYIVGLFIFIIKGYKVLSDKFDKITIKLEDINNTQLILNNPIKKNISLNKIKKSEKYESKNSKLINSINSFNKSIEKLKGKKSENVNLNLNSEKTKKKGEDKINIIYGNSELNLMDYSEAKKLDKRNNLEIYFSLVKTNHPLISSFLPNNDYNSLTIKICLFFFSFCLYFILNSLFFTDETMHQIYEDEGIFNFIYNLPNIIYSTLISSIINFIMKKLALTEESILSLKNEKNSEEKKKKAKNIKKYLKVKFVSFFIISFALLGIFWFYIGCFCAVYSNTQIYLLKDTMISFALSLFLSFIKILLKCLLRIHSLKEPGKFLYKLSKIL